MRDVRHAQRSQRASRSRPTNGPTGSSSGGISPAGTRVNGLGAGGPATSNALSVIADALEAQALSRACRHVGHRTSQMNDALARDDLPGARGRAQARREIEGRASISVLDGHGFPGVETDPDLHREGRIDRALVGKDLLELDRGADRVPGRAEDRERLVAA